MLFLFQAKYARIMLRLLHTGLDALSERDRFEAEFHFQTNLSARLSFFLRTLRCFHQRASNYSTRRLPVRGLDNECQ
jgi:hypothetical protein